MKDTQQFKALVMHKVHLQQQQKQQRLQKRRAITISLSTLCVGIVCVFSVLWFTNVLPLQNDENRGNQNNGSYLQNEGIVEQGQGVAGADKNTDAIPEALPGGSADSTWPPNSTDGNGNAGSDVNSCDPPSDNALGNSSSAPAFLFDSLTLSDLSPQIAADLSLQNGVLTDKIAVQSLVAVADNCIGDTTEQSKDAAILFSLRAEHDSEQWIYTFYQDNTLVVQKGKQRTTHRTDSDAFERLQNALQKVTFSKD